MNYKKTLTEQLNVTDNNQNMPERAVTFDKRRDINIYDTLCLYCKNNDIDCSKIEDNDFDSAVEVIENFKKNINDSYQMGFWID